MVFLRCNWGSRNFLDEFSSSFTYVKGRSFERPFSVLSFKTFYEHPVVLPQVSHFMHVPFRTSVKLPHSLHISPS